MNDQWPPDAPDLKGEFKKAHDVKIEKPAQVSEHPPVTKAEIEALEKQRQPTTPQDHLTPPGMKPPQSAEERQRAARIAKMKQRLKSNQGLARGAFERSAEL